MGRLTDFLEKRPPRREPIQIEWGVGVAGTGCLVPVMLVILASLWGCSRR